MRNTKSRINLQNVTKFQKIVNWKFKKFATQLSTCLKLRYISSSIKMLYTCIIHVEVFSEKLVKHKSFVDCF